jgi:hypothetical protein
MTPKPTEENTRNAAMIFFIDFGGLRFRLSKMLAKNQTGFCGEIPIRSAAKW